jgi:hypothetical protein
MKAIAHLVRWDVRRFRWAILMWLVIVIADTVLTGLRPTVIDQHAAINLGVILELLGFARRLAVLLLVPLIIQAHPAVGTDAFWMTRPIPPRALFAAKAVLLATLMLVVPSVAELALMRSIGVPAREAVFVTLDSLIIRAAWLAVLGAGAVVTLNLPRFAILCGAVFLSFVLLITITLMTARYDEGDYSTELVGFSSGQPVLPPAEDPTAGIVFLLGVTAAGLGLAALQYRTRLRRVSVPAGLASVAVLALAVAYWPFPLLRVPSVLPPWVHNSNAVRLTVASPVIDMTQANGWAPDGVPSVRRGTSRVIVDGLEPGWVPQVQLLRASITLANGSTLGSGRSFSSPALLGNSPDDAARVVTRQLLGVAHLVTPPAYTADAGTTTLALRPAAIDHLIPANGSYRGEFGVSLAHWEVVATLPIRPGAAFQDDSFRFAIDRAISARDAQITVRAREWRATSSFDRKPRIAYMFYVRNAQRTHAMTGHESEAFGSFSSVSFGLPFAVSSGGGPERFFTRAAQVYFPTYYGPPGPAVTWAPEWNDTAELIIVRATEAGTVARTLDIPQAAIIVKR